MRFHVLGVSFAPTNKEYSCDGFSQKVRLFCKMMMDMGHTVYHYGVEGSNPICTENIDVVSKETYDKVHKSYDYKKEGFSYFSETEAQKEFNLNAIKEIYKRKQENDFLCFSFGFPQRPIYDAHQDLISCEIGVGFDGAFAPYKVYESYSWMHTMYGKENMNHTPNIYDAVIPNYYDLNDYIYSEEKDDYFLFIARMTPAKGLEIALKCAEHVGYKLITAGVGEPHLKSPNLIHVGVVDFEQRAKLMSRAKATFVTSNYVEPYGSTVVESLLCGTPVISTDFGAFTENVIHGVVGYRCRTLEQFFWATKNINNIKPINCRNYAVKNYEISHIGEKYQEFFDSLYRLRITENGWYQTNPNRKNLDWLNKYIPDIEEVKKDNRPILCFLIGYTPDIHDINTKDDYGSEITLIKLAMQFIKKYRVLIFGDSIFNEYYIDGIEFYNTLKYNEFQNNNNIDVVIISRYIFHLIDDEIKSRKIFIWIHDAIILPYYKGVSLPGEGKYFVKNISHKIDGFITLTNWHKNYFIEKYDVDPNKVFIISSAIDTNMFKGNFKKQRHKFIWTSHAARGVHKLIEYFHDIRLKIPDAELYIYRDSSCFSQEILDEMEKYDYIHYGGKLDHKKIPDEFESSEIWFYPTNFTESYCMSSVEAQMAKCVCVATDMAALTESIGDRGVLIKEPIWSEEYKEKSINEIIKILNDEELKNKYQEAGYQWAKEQTWENRAKQWYELIDKK